MNDRKATTVGIAVVEHNDCFLVGVRMTGQSLAGHAEFPGGKCRPRETPADCAVRECMEETGLRVSPVRLLDQRMYDYPDACVDLHFWLCHVCCANDVLQEHRGFRWLTRFDLNSQRFPDANHTVVQLLAGFRSDAP